MPVKVRCSCGKLLLVKEQLIGKRIKCPTCAITIQVPSAESKPAEQNVAVPDHATSARPAAAPKPTRPRAASEAEVPLPAEPEMLEDLVAVEPSEPDSPRSRKSARSRSAGPEILDDLVDVEPFESDSRRSRKTTPRRRALWPWIVGGVGGLCLIVGILVFFLMQGSQEDTHLRYTFSDANGYRSGRNRESVAKTLGMSMSQLQEWAQDPAAAEEKRQLGPPLQAGGSAATFFGHGFNETLWRDTSGNEMYTVRNQFLTLTSRAPDSARKLMTINAPEGVPTVEQVRAWAEDESAASEGRSAIIIRAGHTESISRGVLVKPPR